MRMATSSSTRPGPMKEVPRARWGRRTQTSNGGNRGRCGKAARQTLWRLTAVVPDCEHNLCDMARTLRMDENAFHRPCNFKELRVVKKAHIATCALCACWQPLDRIGRTNISTGQRPTELFRTRLIHRWRS